MIFRSLFQGEAGEPLSMNSRKSFRAIARNLGVDELTVSERLQKLRRTGFLRGWLLFFNPNLLGLKQAQLLFEIQPKQKEEQIEKLRPLESVLAIIEHLGTSMYVLLSAEDDESLRGQVKMVESIVGKSSLFLRIPFPLTNLKLSHTDVQIVRALSVDPRRLYSAIATELNLSNKTVKRRLERLIDERAVFTIPSMDPGSLEGGMLVDLLVRYSSRNNRGPVNRELLAKLDDCSVRAQLGDPDYAFFNLLITKISAIRDALKQVKSIEGVREARIDVVQNRSEFFDHYSAQIERRLSILPELQSQTETLDK